MAFKTKDVLIIDATVIIGLLILLTFQSISSTFIETEASDFMREWHYADTQYLTTVELLTQCELLNNDRATYEDVYLNSEYMKAVADAQSNTQSTTGDVSFSDPTGSEFYPAPAEFDLTEELENKIKENCLELQVERIALERHIAYLNYWGYTMAYLEQYDDDGVYTIEHEPFNYNMWTRESGYLHKLITGPFYVNVTNLGMIAPFVFSAAFASFNVLYARWKGEDDETNRASRWSIWLMGSGFIILLIGLAVILTGFFEVYTPFLTDHTSPGLPYGSPWDASGEP